MRGSKSVLIAGVVVTAATATFFKAQQMVAASAVPASASAEPGSDPSLAQRSARQLLRNGLDYLDTYKDHDRALVFLREAQSRPDGLGDREVKALADGLDRAEQARAEAGPVVAATPRPGRPRAPIGSVASSPSRRPGREVLETVEAEPIRRVSAEVAEPSEPTSMDLPELPPARSIAASPSDPPAGVDEPPALGTAESAVALALVKPTAKRAAAKVADPAVKAASEPIYLTAPTTGQAAKPDEPKASLPKAPVDEPLASLPPLPPSRSEPSPAVPPIEIPAIEGPAPNPSPAPRSAPADAPAPPIASPVPDLSPVDAPPIADAPATAPAPAPAADALPAEPVKIVQTPRPTPPPAAANTVTPASRVPVPAPAPEADELPPLPPPASRISSAPAPDAAHVESGLPPESLREVLEVARRQDEAFKQNPIKPYGAQLPSTDVTDVTASGPSETGVASRLLMPRAPSPTEPRPIRVIPVPEEFTTLPPRQWDPNRKFWAASATCHMPLYFQDPVLERYGQGVEQAIGPNGRFFSYPLDDPRQTNQRNQLLQPMYSAGKFLGQIALLPYHMIVDPPWEAEYDLGYYRPGDKVPADTIYAPRRGVGPPLRGSNY